MKKTRLVNNIIRKQAEGIEEQQSVINSFRRLKKTMTGYIDTLERSDRTNTKLIDLLREENGLLGQKISLKDEHIGFLKSLCFVLAAFSIVGWVL